MRRHLTARLLAGALFLLGIAPGLVACGNDRTGGKGQQTAAGTDHEQQLKFAKCMRDNGYDMPDPEPATGGVVVAGKAVSPGDTAFAAAFEQCRSLLPNGGEAPKMTEEQRAKALEFARCMRANGIAGFPDPSADGRFQGVPVPDPSDPAYNAKMTELQQATEQCGGPAGAVPAG
jgi:hypothetical protein